MNEPKFHIGCLVTFINDYGVSFPNKTITEVIEKDNEFYYRFIPTDTSWLIHKESSLFLEYDQKL